jgi:PAS domain S-box-containing protein
VILVFILLLIFYKSSKKIRLQLWQLSATASQLQAGNLSARAPDNSMGEIGTVSTSINEMATNLQIQTERIRQLAQIVEQTNDVFVLFDSSLHIKFVNMAVTELIGYVSADFMGMTMSDFTTKLNLNYLDLLHELDLMSSAKLHIPVRDIVIMTREQVSVDVEMRL